MSEVRASSAEKAAFLLDTALSARSVNAQGRDSHFVFTLHLFQHRWGPVFPWLELTLMGNSKFVIWVCTMQDELQESQTPWF